jgi:ascorbate-specific PTS system EIIC-type component UlaA
MQQLIQRFWKEPAVCIGVITSVILAILAVVTSASWNAETIVGIIAPTASALGIRSQVTPFVGQYERQNETGTKSVPQSTPTVTTEDTETVSPSDTSESGPVEGEQQ